MPVSDGQFDLALPAELEARTDEVLHRLDDLNRRIERALAELSPLRIAAETVPDR